MQKEGTGRKTTAARMVVNLRKIGKNTGSIGTLSHVRFHD